MSLCAQLRSWTRVAPNSPRRIRADAHAWSDLSVLDATWEDAKFLRDRHPTLLARGQASSIGGGDVSVPADKETVPAGDHGFNPKRASKRVPRIAQPNRRFLGPEWAT
ncbi:hypothetical protein D1007_10600 [Hordeum vulgare]|nr:hypothetical protein D1007_10600 [Hordeum vulgare]